MRPQLQRVHPRSLPPHRRWGAWGRWRRARSVAGRPVRADPPVQPPRRRERRLLLRALRRLEPRVLLVPELELELEPEHPAWPLVRWGLPPMPPRPLPLLPGVLPRHTCERAPTMLPEHLDPSPVLPSLRRPDLDPSPVALRLPRRHRPQPPQLSPDPRRLLPPSRLLRRHRLRLQPSLLRLSPARSPAIRGLPLRHRLRRRQPLRRPRPHQPSPSKESA